MTHTHSILSSRKTFPASPTGAAPLDPVCCKDWGPSWQQVTVNGIFHKTRIQYNFIFVVGDFYVEGRGSFPRGGIYGYQYTQRWASGPFLHRRSRSSIKSDRRRSCSLVQFEKKNSCLILGIPSKFIVIFIGL